MKKPMNKTLISAAAATALSLSMASSVWAGSEPGAEPMIPAEGTTMNEMNQGAAAQSDEWITEKVQQNLGTEVTLKTANINVDTMKGIVTLTGTVATDEARDKAVELAEAVDGVNEVKAEALTSPK
ncbi:hyperosmotically inducible protein [Pseudomonas marincola]|nr:hyperosmotically inducible protein [Pseudomonas marincola]